jgi:hypothetical protein
MTSIAGNMTSAGGAMTKAAAKMTSAGGAAMNNAAGNMMMFSVSNNMTNATGK